MHIVDLQNFRGCNFFSFFSKFYSPLFLILIQCFGEFPEDLERNIYKDRVAGLDVNGFCFTLLPFLFVEEVKGEKKNAMSGVRTLECRPYGGVLQTLCYVSSYTIYPWLSITVVRSVHPHSRILFSFETK